MTLDTFKSYLTTQIGDRLQLGRIPPIEEDRLEQLRKYLSTEDTLSSLSLLLHGYADLLYKQLGPNWIKRLSEVATPQRLAEQNLLINPTRIAKLAPYEHYVALYTEPGEALQCDGQVHHIGPVNLHLQGGMATLQGASTAHTEGNSEIYAYDQTKVYATEHAHVTLYNQSFCEAKDQCRVDAHMQSLVIAQGQNQLRLDDSARGIAQAYDQSWKLRDQAQLLIDAMEQQAHKHILVKMQQNSYLFTRPNQGMLAISQALAHRGRVVTCPSDTVWESLKQHFKRNTPTDQPHYWINEPLPIAESKQLLLPELPSSTTSEERNNVQQATDEHTLCAAVEQIMRNHPDHAIQARTLAAAVTNATLLANHIYLYASKTPIIRDNGHYHIYGNNLLTINFGDKRTYHLCGHATAISETNTPIIASQQARLLQLGADPHSQLHGEAIALLLGDSKVYAHGHSQVFAGGHAAVTAYDQAHVDADDQAKVKLCDQATGLCKGETHVTAKGESRVVGANQAQLDLYEHSTGAAMKESQVKVTVYGEYATATLLENEQSAQEFLKTEQQNSLAKEPTKSRLCHKKP